MNRNSVFHAILLTAGILLALYTAVSAQQETPPPSDDDVNRIARQMYCPVCENIPLDICATEACEQWRELIREKLAAGWTDDRIKEYFVRQYGDRVLAEPPRRGFNRLVYIVPAVIFLAGAYVLFRVLRGMQTRVNGDTHPEIPKMDGQDAYEHRVEEALRERRK